MRRSTQRLTALLDARARKHFWRLLGLILIASLLEVVGVGMALPFIQLLQEPESFRHIAAAAILYEIYDQHGERTFVLLLAAIYLSVILIKNGALTFIIYYRNRFLYYNRSALAKRLYRHYLHAPFQLHLQVNTAEMLRNVTGTVGQFTNGLYQLSIILIEALTFATIFVLLFFVSQYAVAIMAVFLGLFGFTFVYFLRSRTTRWGQRSEVESLGMIKWVNQGLDGVKEIRILGRETYFDRHFSSHADRLAGYLLRHNTANELPRLFIEVLMIGGICIALSVFVISGQNLGELLPLLGLFAVAGLRLMPSANRMITAYNGLKFSAPAIDILYDTVFDPDARRPAAQNTQPSRFERDIRLENVTFSYGGRSRATLADVDLVIRKGERIGVTGHTGAGKTTLVDLLMGLHVPEQGKITIDDVDVTGQPAAFHGMLGYVPQQVHLIDDTLARNIALGLEDSEISLDQVRQAISLASLDDLVAQLPDGLETDIGEDGVRLSGGQRQRIGIARALYNNPDILVFDEATSSLDYETEERISRSIDALSSEKTIIVIAHRLSTVRACDRILFMKDGAIAALGSFDALLSESPDFHKLVDQMTSAGNADVAEDADTDAVLGMKEPR